MAVHCQGIDPPEHDHSLWEGEAKVVLTGIAASGEHLVIERWTPQGGIRRIERH